MSEEKKYRFPGHKERLTREQWLREGNEGKQEQETATKEETQEAAA